MHSTKQFELGWAVIYSETEEVAFIDDCPQVVMSFDDAQSVTETLNELNKIRERKTVP